MIESVVVRAFSCGYRLGQESQAAPAASAPARPETVSELQQQLAALERRLIERAYEEGGGVKTEIAKLLGIKTSALYYKLHKYGIGTISGRPHVPE